LIDLTELLRCWCWSKTLMQRTKSHMQISLTVSQMLMF